MRSASLQNEILVCVSLEAALVAAPEVESRLEQAVCWPELGLERAHRLEIDPCVL